MGRRATTFWPPHRTHEDKGQGSRPKKKGKRWMAPTLAARLVHEASLLWAARMCALFFSLAEIRAAPKSASSKRASMRAAISHGTTASIVLIWLRAWSSFFLSFFRSRRTVSFVLAGPSFFRRWNMGSRKSPNGAPPARTNPRRRACSKQKKDE